MPPAPERVPEISEVERALLRHLADWPDALETAAGQLNPTLVTTYAYELAQHFTDFYENMPVLKAPEGERPFRLWLVALSRAVLADALDVLGLPAPERM